MRVFVAVFLGLVLSAAASAADLKVKVVDPQSATVAGAQVSLVCPAGESKVLLATRNTAADGTVTQLDTHRESYARATSPERWRASREDARGIAQWAVVHAKDSGPDTFDMALRDAAMTENVDWILAEAIPHQKIALWIIP